MACELKRLVGLVLAPGVLAGSGLVRRAIGRVVLLALDLDFLVGSGVRRRSFALLQLRFVRHHSV